VLVALQDFRQKSQPAVVVEAKLIDILQDDPESLDEIAGFFSTRQAVNQPSVGASTNVNLSTLGSVELVIRGGRPPLDLNSSSKL
jgi:hypothetical protein